MVDNLLEEGFLQQCYYDLGANRASGIDRVSWKGYGKHLEDNLQDLVALIKGRCCLVRYCDDFICMVQRVDEAQHIKQTLQERFAKFDLEIHPEKTRVISFGRYEGENTKRQKRRANTFDFLGFTHYCGEGRKGKFIVGCTTSRKKFQKKCKELNVWLKATRDAMKTKEWWPILAAKLRGHY